MSNRSVDKEEKGSILNVLPKAKIRRANQELISKRVAIVGGSIGGLAVANCLQKAGFRNIKVLEQRPAQHIAGAGVGLDDVSVSILKELISSTCDQSNNVNNLTGL